MLPPLTYGILAQNRNRTYAQILTEDYGADVVWPLVDIASGTTITAYNNASYNGTLTGWDLQNAPGPVPGTLAPYSDGANDRGDGFSTALANIFNGSIGSMFMWCNISSHVALGRILYLYSSSVNNRIIIQNQNSGFLFYYQAGETPKSFDYGAVSTGQWFSLGMSWKDSNNGDEVNFYVNGNPASLTFTGNGAFSGSLTGFGIGSNYDAGANVINGLMAYPTIKFGSIWTPTDFLNMHNAALTAKGD